MYTFNGKMCEITTDNFDIKFQEIAYTLQKANYIGKSALVFLKDTPLNVYILTLMFEHS